VVDNPDVYLHPTALCESDQVGAGTRIWAFAHVLSGAVIGVDCNVGDHAFVEGGARLGDRVTVKNSALIWDGVTVEDEVFLGPRCTFTNDLRPRIGFAVPPGEYLPTLVRRGASLGASVTVVCGVTIGRYAFVGAGAVVTTDVADHAAVVGVPARQVGWVCVCARPLDDSLTCGCGRSFEVNPAGGLRGQG
jgi:UDP-2-acetamido-3-amino-2,3-dideoxy-glucuronate N-acetyltransferase